MKYITTMMILALLSGCAVDNDEVFKSIALCEAHGGLENISPAYFFWGLHAQCNNGVRYSDIGDMLTYPEEID